MQGKGKCNCRACCATNFYVYDDEANTYVMYVENDGVFKYLRWLKTLWLHLKLMITSLMSL